jgi:hypothetical protein
VEKLNTQDAAALLRESVNEPDGYWSQYLVNNRRPGRKTPYRIPFTKVGGAVQYDRADLAKFIEWEKGRRLGGVKLTGRAAEVMAAYGIGEAGGSSSGRKLDCAINPQVDPVTGKPYLQLILNNPLLVFRVELDQARLISAELAETIRVCERAAA